MKWILASLLFVAVSGQLNTRWLEMTPDDQQNGVTLTLYNRDHRIGYPIWPESYVPRRTQQELDELEETLRTKPMKIVVHGFWSRSSKFYVKGITKNYLKVENCNVILVNWEVLARGVHRNERPNKYIPNARDGGLTQYEPASRFAMDVGGVLANFLMSYIIPGNPYFDLHLIGHSLGAHAVGRAGRILSRNGYAPRRVTGLDPAGPRFEQENLKGWVVDPELEMIGKDSGQFVDIIHTNPGALGARQALGDIDFYVNGGKRFQKCARAPKPNPLRDYLSHGYATKLFIETILNPSDRQYISPQCRTYNPLVDTRWTPICGGFDNGFTRQVGYGAMPVTRSRYIIPLLTDAVRCSDLEPNADEDDDDFIHIP